jgi:hypothetical protein
MESGEVRVDLFSPAATWPTIPFANDVHVTTSGLMGHPTVSYRAAPPGGDGSDAGHAGGDDGLMEAFVQSVREGWSGARVGTSLTTALDSHWLALAAEQARMGRRMIRLDPTAPDLAPR